MAEPSLDDAEFWLPSQFLTDDDILVDKNNLKKNGVGSGFLKSRLNFPTEFPYQFDSLDSLGSSSTLSSPVESLVGSTETDSSDEEDFLAGLTRRLALSNHRLAVPGLTQDKIEEKSRVMASSPQSTLSGVGSWSVSSNGSPNGPSQVSSPPTTPFGGKDDTWDLIYAAAGQVARLKMSNEGPVKYVNQQGKGLLGPPRAPNPVPLVKNPNSGLCYNQSFSRNLAQTNQYMRQELVMKQQCASAMEGQVRGSWQAQQPQQQIQRGECNLVGYENRRCGRPLGLPQSAWPPLQQQHQKQHELPPQPQPQPQHSGPGMRAVFLGGSGVKRECAGTGVFLPRRYGNPPDTRKKAGCSTVLLPARVVQALNLNFDDMNGYSQPRFNPAFAQDFDGLIARRNSLLTQQKRSFRPDGTLSHEKRLPQEWTY